MMKMGMTSLVMSMDRYDTKILAKVSVTTNMTSTYVFLLSVLEQFVSAFCRLRM